MADYILLERQFIGNQPVQLKLDCLHEMQSTTLQNYCTIIFDQSDFEKSTFFKHLNLLCSGVETNPPKKKTKKTCDQYIPVFKPKVI